MTTTETTEFKDGDWVTTFPLSFTGTAENVDRRMMRIRLDPDHGHFRDTVISQNNEVRLVRDAAGEAAEWAIGSAQGAVKRADEMIAFHQQKRREALAELRAARGELREARKLPRRSPHVDAHREAAGA